MMKTIPVAPFDYLVFGGSGDLSMRKLLPALYFRDHDGQLSEGSRIILASRGDQSTEELVPRVREAIGKHVAAEFINDDIWRRFVGRLTYLSLDATAERGWDNLVHLLQDQPDRIRVFYLATAPDLFGDICRNLARHNLITPQARVVLEKPIGHDLASARHINEAVGSVFAEHQIFRIDHYLGKEAVQNLLALRFANSLFETLWNRTAIDHVQITVAETIGVESRGGYYDKSGALRDMVQNHLLQLLCLVAMDSPSSLRADDVRDEKLKVLRALKPITAETVGMVTVRGQYRGGAIGGASVAGYLDDLGEPTSDTETFVALKAEVASWRWAGVPFYLRTGKRLPERVSEIVVQFRPVSLNIFPAEAGLFSANRLVIRLQPDEGIKLELVSKDPGPGGLRLRNSALNLSYAEAFKIRFPEAYERLLMDVVRGNATLFMRRDEVEAAWSWVEPILDGWSRTGQAPKPYTSGTWGPSSAIALIERDGRTWHDEPM
ncbi:glucose-6-phosphate 1-dehydrogenase [Aliidongia dinghuensis]|uniref:Glucose-6-phosphate 1-dehydrogenase n=1 Tax=Aliidongia dinghuensis TaxID=1867774 RepID=A0A8J3E4K8_9PROT|nr:glucose-6-phosphate dehydrogenase [Aliidongia dinghuensis]GGF27956.1 glucose-6-phosphate 1-dehydrogenase [Aliidongia dinghuensis]